MTRSIAAIALFLLLFAAFACGADDSEEGGFETTTTAATSFQSFDTAMDESAMSMASAPTAPAAAAIAGKVEADDGGSGSAGGSLQVSDRKIISTGNITVEVEDVPTAVMAVEAIADGMGGYVEQLSSSGGDDYQRASLTIRVPQGQFDSAYDRIRELGDVLNEHQGSEDVSEQFIDLEARLNSAKREEQSLLNLLGRAGTVSDVLSIERELSRVRSDIERYQGQLDFLSRRVDLSTIWVELTPEEGRPPFANLRLTVDDVPGSLDRVRSIIASYDGDIRGGTIYDEDGEQRADLNARVFYGDFRDLLNEMERVGDVDGKTIREPVLDPDGGEERDPEARLSIQLEQPDNSWMFVTGAVVVLGALLVVVAFIGVRSYRGRRRRAVSAE